VLVNRVRDVSEIESAEVMPNTNFFSRALSDPANERRGYFDELESVARDSALVFFDRDNGLDVKSVRYGGKRSSKYLFRSEVERFHCLGHSLLIY